MGGIDIKLVDITKAGTDCIVNAANSGLCPGSGVCGAIFHSAGSDELEEACRRIGHCDTGSAVITPAFRIDARYIIHAVGPVWHGGGSGEAELLAGAYQSALDLCVEHDCHSIAFPLISAGIYGYPKEQAWDIALDTCRMFLDEHPDSDLEIVFAVVDPDMLALGKALLEQKDR